MTKMLVIPSSMEMMKNLNKLCDGFIIGIDDFCINLPVTFSLEQIKTISDIYKEKDIFVAINKNIHNEEVESLKEILKNLDMLPISGVIYYDVAIVELKKKLGLKFELVWNQEHLTTNYATCNFWSSYGVSAAYLSSDITFQELLDIKKNTALKLFVNVFGYLPMFASFRHLVKNYLTTFSLNDSVYETYKIEKEGKEYTIIDNKLGSFVYSNNILNGLEEYLILKDNGFDYVVLNSFQIDDEKFKIIVELFKKVERSNVKEYSDIIYDMFYNVDKGFFYKETVYKVKNNE